MRYLLLSVLVVCVIGVMIPSAFAIGSGGINCVDFPRACQAEILKKYFGEGYGLGNFQITYLPSDKYPGYDTWVRSGMGIAPNFFDREILWLNQTFKLPHNVPIVFLDCDMEINNDFIFQHALIHKKRDVIGVHSKILPPKTIKLNKFQRYLYSKKRGGQKLNEDKPLPFNYFIIGCTSIKKKQLKNQAYLIQTFHVMVRI